MRSLIALTVLALSFGAFAATADQVCLDRNGKELDTSLATVTRIVYGHGNRPQIFVTGKIVSIGAEDHNGLPHQKFKIQVSNDISLDIVTNLDFGRIPVAVGKQISICGEFKNVGKGMVHWTHFDPHGGHPDGFSIIDGKLYGDKEE